MRNMSDRLAALAGRLKVRSAPRPGHDRHRGASAGSALSKGVLVEREGPVAVEVWGPEPSNDAIVFLNRVSQVRFLPGARTRPATLLPFRSLGGE